MTSNLYIFNMLHSLTPEIDPSLLTNKSLSEFLNEYFPSKLDPLGRKMPQVIVIDQLEELFYFTLGPDPQRWRKEQAIFFTQIAETLNKDLDLRFVLVIRESYLDKLDPFISVLPGKLKARFKLEYLSKDAEHTRLLRDH